MIWEEVIETNWTFLSHVKMQPSYLHLFVLLLFACSLFSLFAVYMHMPAWGLTSPHHITVSVTFELKDLGVG